MSTEPASVPETTTASRRDVLLIAGPAFAAVGGLLALWPLIQQMNPHPGTPRPDIVTVDLDGIAAGTERIVPWRGKPVIVRHRTPDEVDRARAAPLEKLRDSYARNARLPADALATDANRVDPSRPQWLVVIGLCTHLGCLLKSAKAIGVPDLPAGWFCPCHAAKFDTAGRVIPGPAATNLPVPAWRFTGAGQLEIGVA